MIVNVIGSALELRYVRLAAPHFERMKEWIGLRTERKRSNAQVDLLTKASLERFGSFSCSRVYVRPQKNVEATWPIAWALVIGSVIAAERSEGFLAMICEVPPVLFTDAPLSFCWPRLARVLSESSFRSLSGARTPCRKSATTRSSSPSDWVARGLAFKAFPTALPDAVFTGTGVAARCAGVRPAASIKNRQATNAAGNRLMLRIILFTFEGFCCLR